ncbi:MAG: cytochrome c [Burkholderiales bacterium]|nr:cytochrome c [Burkholderiales bacterium]
MKSFSQLVVGLLLAFGIAAGVQAQAPFKKAEDAIKYRKSALFVMAQHFGRIAPVVKGEKPYDKDEVAMNAAIAEQMSKLPFAGFVAGTDTGDTDAKPEIWTDAAKFKSAEEKMQQEMSKLAEVAKGGNLDAIKAQFGATGKACKACHDDFRKKK